MEEQRDDKKKEVTNRSLRKNNKPSASTDNINKVVNFFKDNNKFGIVILVAVVLLVLVLVLDKTNKEDPNAGTGSDEIIVNPTEESTADPTEYELKKDAVPQLNELVTRYFEAMKNCDAESYTNIVAGEEMTAEKLQKKGEYIEDYRNISCYTKPGMTEGSYVAFVYYEVKFHNVETLAPALSQLYICTNEDGSMYINAGSLDAELAGYISTVRNDEQVRQLESETDEKLAQAEASDENLKTFLELLRKGIDYTSEPETSASEPETDISEMVFEERDEEVLTTATVRYRSTPTTDSDDNVQGKIEEGESVRRIGYNEKWSKISYKGQEVYVSSDYLIAK